VTQLMNGTGESLAALLSYALADPGLVQSFSGVRTVYGHGPEITQQQALLASAYGWCYVRRVVSAGKATILVGRDPRPTGEALVRALVHGFLAGGLSIGCRIDVIDLGIITTPLAETAVRSLEADGGVMVTASHNPLEHNGFKFLTGCRSDGSGEWAPPGALLSASMMGKVIADVASLSDDVSKLAKDLSLVSDSAISESLGNPVNESSRIQAERAYLDTIGRDWGIAPHCLKPLTLGPALLDPNGGAGCGINARVLEHFGVRVIEINAELGYPEHGIDTDGLDPASGRHMLLRAARAAARERAHFGVAFDYDADRGNLVLPGQDESAIIPPQRVAAFNVALALARRRLSGAQKGPLAVVISDATSLASERVAEAFGAEVMHVETGEINVVTKMHLLRGQGYDVPVGVEGANGGTIFETSTCRDGLQAALSAALAESQPQVACEWMRIAATTNGGSFDPERSLSLAALVESVPTNPNVFLKFTSQPISHGEIKRRMEDYFRSVLWPKLESRFASLEFENFEGTERVAERTGDESGGWRASFKSPGRRAFVFLRGSRTEAGVWRMIVDADDVDDFHIISSGAKEAFAASTR
jgi:phosphoglucomutase